MPVFLVRIGLSIRDLSSCFARLIHEHVKSFGGAKHWTHRLHSICLWGEFNLQLQQIPCFPQWPELWRSKVRQQMRLFTFVCSQNVFIRKTKSLTSIPYMPIVQDLTEWHTILDFQISYCFTLFTNLICLLSSLDYFTNYSPVAVLLTAMIPCRYCLWGKLNCSARSIPYFLCCRFRLLGV